MDTLKDSLDAMAEMFQQKMSEFQQGLDNAPTTNTSLVTEFNSFRTFVICAMNTLQRQVEFLGTEVDRLEMRKRRKMLLLHGVREDKAEDLTSSVCSIVTEHLGVSGFSPASVKSSYRLGRLTTSSKKPRPIVVKFADVTVRDKVWFSKTSLKGSGITESEFLTKNRHNIFMEARQRFGISKCWTRDGCIHIIAPDGTRHRAECKADLENLSASTSKPQAHTNANLPARSKRLHKK